MNPKSSGLDGTKLLIKPHVKFVSELKKVMTWEHPPHYLLVCLLVCTKCLLVFDNQLSEPCQAEDNLYECGSK